jgi:hypothetical protein
MRILLLTAALAGCSLQPHDAPEPYLTCHNSNCRHSDPVRDDTVEALRESLALELQGRAMIDGTEIDLIWEPRGQRCVFEHDHVDAAGAPDASVPAAVLAAHLRDRGLLATWNGERFFLKLELKPGAAPDERQLSPEEMEALADCALARSGEVQAAADDAGLALTVLYESQDIPLLRVLRDRPGWRSDLAGRRGPRQFVVNPYRDVRGLESDVGVVTLNWWEIRDGDYTRFQDLKADGVDMMMGGFDATEKALGSYEDVSPTYINTNEAPLVRRWIAEH